MVNDIERKIDIEIERNRIRISIFHGEDEQIIKLTLEEAEEFAEILLLNESTKAKGGGQPALPLPGRLAAPPVVVVILLVEV